MAKILKFTPKAHLDTETLDRMAAVAAERFRSLPSAIRKGQEPPSQMVCGLIKGAQAADVARWLYQNLTLPKKQFAEFRKVVTDAGIANNITGGTALDALIERTVPGVRKAVKWNSPLYGGEGEGWFLGIHCFKRYVKLAFFRGTSLDPMPPGESRSNDTRYFHIHEGDDLDERQLADWVRQASQLPGERM